jgi:hypothetical protein
VTALAAIEQIEKKRGSVFTTYDANRVSEKAASTPGTLTDEDLVVVAFFHGEHRAAEAREKRDKALHPLADPPAAVAATPAAGVEFPDHLWDTEAPDQVAEMERWSAANILKVLPLGIWWKFTLSARQKREALAAKVDALETRIKELEARPVVKDAGVWRSGVMYENGDIVSHGGGAWICRAAHYSTGMLPSTDFRLFVKAGRDGRSGR